MAPIPINQNVTVGTTLAPVGTPLVLNGACRNVSLSIVNTGSAALTGFAIQRQFVDGGIWLNWLTGTDFDTPTSKCNASGGSSGSHVYSVAPAASAWIDFDPGAAVAVQFLASASAATTLTLAGGARLEDAE
jgi:hypothetical protein